MKQETLLERIKANQQILQEISNNQIEDATPELKQLINKFEQFKDDLKAHDSRLMMDSDYNLPDSTAKVFYNLGRNLDMIIKAVKKLSLVNSTDKNHLFNTKLNYDNLVKQTLINLVSESQSQLLQIEELLEDKKLSEKNAQIKIEKLRGEFTKNLRCVPMQALSDDERKVFHQVYVSFENALKSYDNLSNQATFPTQDVKIKDDLSSVTESIEIKYCTYAQILLDVLDMRKETNKNLPNILDSLQTISKKFNLVLEEVSKLKSNKLEMSNDAELIAIDLGNSVEEVSQEAIKLFSSVDEAYYHLPTHHEIGELLRGRIKLLGNQKQQMDSLSSMPAETAEAYDNCLMSHLKSIMKIRENYAYIDSNQNEVLNRIYQALNSGKTIDEI